MVEIENVTDTTKSWEYSMSYDKQMEQQRKDIKEFKDRERTVEDKFIANYYQRNPKEGWSFWDMDKDILIKILQNDIRLFLQKVWNNFSWDITISYKSGVPNFMKATFEAINKESNWNATYQDFLTFVSDYGIITHKRYGKEKKLYWEKLYRYSDKDWDVDVKGSPIGWLWKTIKKKDLKKH